MAPRWDKRLRLPKSEGGATICEKHEFIEAHFRDPEMSWEVDQAVTQAKDDGKRMEARLQELGEEANNLEDALSETEADRDRLAAELHAVRDELATAHEDIILSRQSEGDTMADLLATREERDKLRAELGHLRSAPAVVEVPEPDTIDQEIDIDGTGMRDVDLVLHGYRVAVSRIKPIPSDRVLKDGHVQVPETDVAMIRRCLDECAWDDILQPIVDWTDRMSDALRSNGGE